MITNLPLHEQWAAQKGMDLERLVYSLPKREIYGRDGLYLTRYKLFGSIGLPGDDRIVPCSAFIHHFHTPDQDRDLHSHPWNWSEAVVIRGGYMERRSRVRTWFKSDVSATKPELAPQNLEDPEPRIYLPGQRNRFEVGDYHTIDQLYGDTWTLFICGPAITSWGFWVPGQGHVPWRVYLAERGLNNDEPE